MTEYFMTTVRKTNS